MSPVLGTTTAYRPSFGQPASQPCVALRALPANAHGVVTDGAFPTLGSASSPLSRRFVVRRRQQQVSGPDPKGGSIGPWPIVWGELLRCPIRAPTKPGLTHLCQCRLFRGQPGTPPQLLTGRLQSLQCLAWRLGERPSSRSDRTSGMEPKHVWWCHAAMIFRGTSPAIRRPQVSLARSPRSERAKLLPVVEIPTYIPLRYGFRWAEMAGVLCRSNIEPFSAGQRSFFSPTKTHREEWDPFGVGVIHQGFQEVECRKTPRNTLRNGDGGPTLDSIQQTARPTEKIIVTSSGFSIIEIPDSRVLS